MAIPKERMLGARNGDGESIESYLSRTGKSIIEKGMNKGRHGKVRQTPSRLASSSGALADPCDGMSEDAQ